MKVKEHRLTDIKDIKRFILAGKAIFTLESTRTGRWFTYKVVKKTFEDNVFYFVNVLTGQDNENSYTYLGVVNLNFHLSLTKKSKISEDSLSFKALNFFLNYIKNEKLHDEVNFYHEGVCGKCGRRLTTPDSVKIGLGPVCRDNKKETLGDKRKKKIQKINRMLLIK